MKKNIIYIRTFCFALAFIAFSSCTDGFDDINTNPDASTEANASILATNLIYGITANQIGRNKGFLQDYMLGKYLCYSEFPDDNQYNKFGRIDYEDLVDLNNIAKMIEYAAEDPGQLKSYTALGHVIRALRFYDLTMRLGDIPYSEAIQGESEGITKPKYDSQKNVIIGILNELKEADRLFGEGDNFEGDFIFGGNVKKWQKVANSFALKILINLYLKTGDSDLQVTQRFKEIVDNRPIFTNSTDNFELVYSNISNQWYAFYEEGNPYVIYPSVSTTIIDMLKGFNDNRLFYYAAPSPVQIEGGLSVNDPDAYVGIEPSILYSELSTIYSSRDYSDLNNRYKFIPEGEPVSILSYAELQFILAEAALRGWISSSAEDHYVTGIKSSLTSVAFHTPDDPDFHHNMKIDNAYIQSYPETPGVKFSADPAIQFEQIITQKYLYTFLQSPQNAYFENRRTGFPYFKINPESNQNQPSDKLPIRWLYPSSELDYNSENLDQALSSQYGGVDDTNQVMWILK